MLGLDELLERKPAQLSGGQRQRVAMGRAIVRAPRAFLMDEPLSNLDAKLRVGMRASLAQLHRQLGTTTVYVTHDQVEAMTLGQRVAVMRDGRILQVDAPQRLYEQPRDVFVAGFIGSPAMNLVEATIDGDSSRFGQFRVPLDPSRRPAAARSGSGRARDQAGELRGRGLRPRRPAHDRGRRRRRRGARLRRACVLPGRRAAHHARGDRRRRARAAEARRGRGALLNARVDPRTAARVGARFARGRSRALSLLRSRDRREPARGRPAREPGAGPVAQPKKRRRLVLTTRCGRLGLVPS